MATYTWKGGLGSRDLSDANNWANLTLGQDPALQPPGSADSVTIDPLGGTLSGIGTSWDLFLAGGGTLAGTLSWADGFNLVSASPFTVTAGATLQSTGGTGFVDLGWSSAGTLAIDGAGALFNAGSDELILGMGVGGVAVVNVADGGTLETGANYTFLANPNSTAAVTVDGPGSRWSATWGVIIGQGGATANPSHASVTISDGGQISTYNVSVGQGAGASGTLSILSSGTLVENGTTSWTEIANLAGSTGQVIVSGTTGGAASTWTDTNQGLMVGNYGTGTLLISDGGEVSAHLVGVGQAAGSNGSLSILSGGTLVENGTTSYTEIGNLAGSTGQVIVSGTSGSAASTWTDTNLGLMVGNYGTGTLSIAAGGKVVNAGTLLWVGNNAGGNGSLIITAGGTLLDTRDPTLGGADGPVLTVGNLAGSTGTVLVSGAGALIDLGGNGLRIADSGSGALTVAQGGSVVVGSYDSNQTNALRIGRTTGSGSLTVTDLNSSFTTNGYATVGRGGQGSLLVENHGLFTINDAPANGGGLGIGAGSSSSATYVGGSGSATVTSGGVLDLNSTGSGITVGAYGVTGALRVDNGGTVLSGNAMTVGSAASIGGTIYGGSGTLNVGAGGLVELTVPSRASTYAFTIGSANSSIAGPTTLSNGAVTVSGAGARLDTDGNSMAVGYSGNGTLTVSQGGTVLTGTPNSSQASALSIARLGTGSVTITDTGSRLIGNGEIYIGRAGNGSLTVANSATLQVLLDGLGAGGFYVGGANYGTSTSLMTGGAGTALVTTGADVLSQAEIRVGNGGGTGSLTVQSGGTVEAGTQLLVGNNATVSAGGTDITTTGTATLAVTTTFTGSGTITVGTGGVLRADGTGLAGNPDIVVGADAGSNGVLNVGALGTVDASGGTIVVGSAGAGRLTASAGAIITAGTGEIDIGALGSLIGAGTLTAGALVVTGTAEASGGTLELTGTVSGSGTLAIDSGASLRVDGALQGGLTTAFRGSGGLLLDAGAGPAANNTADATGFVLGDSIHVLGHVLSSDSIATGASGAYGTINWTDGTTLSFDFAGDYDGAEITVGSDGAGAVITTDLACFAAGTRLRVPSGWAAVERLSAGNAVVTANGRTATVRWVGHRRVDCTRHPRPADVWPVRVQAGAVGTGVPLSDVRLSPDHALFIDGVLIPVRYLVNGASIAQEKVRSITYYHVELDAHDVLLAEGMPAESYLDTGNRGAFANGGGASMLHPDFALRVWKTQACAPLVTSGAELLAARSWLLERANALGYLFDREPALRVTAGGTRLAAESENGAIRLRLPAGAGTVRLESRVFVPAHVYPESNDWRRLGVAVTGLRLDGVPVQRNDARLRMGWHDAEPDWRWTDGAASLDVGDAVLLELRLAPYGFYWQHATRAAAAA